MPIPAAMIPTILPAAASAAGSVINAAQTGRQNKKSRKWSEKMYERQRADNLEFWNMQNEFNSPEAQRARLESAGLNPNLAYGGSPAQTAGSAGDISSPETPRPEFNPAMIGTGVQQLAQFYDYELKQAKTDNLRANTEVQFETQLLKAAETFGKQYDVTSKKYSAMLNEQLFDTSLEMGKERLRKLQADTQYTLDQNERANLMLSPNLQSTIEDILSKRLGRQLTTQQIKNLRLDEKIKKLDSDFADMGLRPTDPLWAKFVGSAIGFLMDELGSKYNMNFKGMRNNAIKKLLGID
jgi:hypothetical protein